jgi:hypothetical protein
MIRGNTLKRSSLGLGLCLLIVTSGCSGGDSGPKLVAAKGTVKYNGNPIAGASVVFSPKEGTPGTATTDKDGNFTLTTGGRPGVIVGKSKVVISKATSVADGKTAAQMTPQDMMKMATKGEIVAKKKGEIPEKYSSLDTTTENADVTADAKSNVFEFNLVD